MILREEAMMGRCQWDDCISDATKVVYRPATNDEQRKSTVITERGASWIGLIEISVCEAHLDEAQKEYPYIANKNP